MARSAPTQHKEHTSTVPCFLPTLLLPGCPSKSQAGPRGPPPCSILSEGLRMGHQGHGGLPSERRTPDTPPPSPAQPL